MRWDDILLVDERNDAHLLAPVRPPLWGCPSDAISLRSIPVSTSNTAADRSGNHVEDPPNAQTARRPPAHAGRVEVQILAEGVNGHDNAGNACGQAQACAQKLDQALVGDAAEDALGQQRPEELDLLLVAEPAALAGEGQQAVLLAVIAPDVGEAAGQVPALEELLNHLWDDGRQEAIAGLEPLLVGLEQLVEMV
jgi:hypothetical protein